MQSIIYTKVNTCILYIHLSTYNMHDVLHITVYKHGEVIVVCSLNYVYKKLAKKGQNVERKKPTYCLCSE